MSDSQQPPVLLVHGWAGSFDHTWKRAGLVDLLADANREVVPYDLPGHGTSTKSHDPAAYADLSGDLLAAAHRAGTPIDAVGFSLGAITLLRASLRSPESFRRVVLAGIGDGVFFPHDPSRSERILSGLEGRAAPGDVTARIFGKIGNEAHNDPAALAAVLRRPREDPMTTDQLATLVNPVLVVLGDKDFSAPAERLVAAIAQARLVTLKGIDHFRTPEAFGFIDAVLEFLGSP